MLRIDGVINTSSYDRAGYAAPRDGTSSAIADGLSYTGLPDCYLGSRPRK